ncbi:CaiB/BaiF CoA transferase family protein [Futiania mangrovi]|uniref:CoA transferase n=1 Tax=Futiania mangrovi TaxID=2959716 RepID=A0A9J6PCF3_9PROT|nr:CaiB/BaiF CoA-transferase family protein [Futiania mangrovii]MCP1335472.1 CoA transferase [Futiania mangrovii]
MNDTPGRSATARPPLRGIRVLDFSWLLPGPFCTMQLAELGADVVKIEGPQGDYAREMLPGLFAVANRNKRSVSIDLKAPGALAIVDRMVERADVVIEGFRPGVADRLGIGYERLSEINPQIVYASVSGFGSCGPLAAHPGHDINYLAYSGVLSIPGQWDRKIARGALPVADLSAAMTAALSIVASLLDSRASGRGRYLDVAMLPALMSWAQVRTADHLAAEDGSWPHLNPLNDIYETQDGKLVSLALVEPKFLRAFCEAAGCEEILTSGDYDAFAGRHDLEAGQRLSASVRGVIASRSAADWDRLLILHGVPYAPVLTPSEALDNPQLGALGLGTRAPEGIPKGYFPFPVPGVSSGRAMPAPGRGEHTAEVLKEFGIAEADIAGLHSAHQTA